MFRMNRFPLFVAVDIGNTRSKFACFEDKTILKTLIIPNAGVLDGETLQRWLEDIPQALCWQIACVRPDRLVPLLQWLTDHRKRDSIRVLGYQDVPMRVEIPFPEKLGIDRLLAAHAAYTVRDFPLPLLVIDLGTAVTIDLVSADGCFLGGAILPGLMAMAKSLSQDAEQLPLLQFSRVESVGSPVESPTDSFPVFPGRNTEEAIRAGLIWSLVGAIDRFTEMAESHIHQRVSLMFTGGDAWIAEPLKQHLERSIDVEPYLVLQGISLLSDRSGG